MTEKRWFDEVGGPYVRKWEGISTRGKVIPQCNDDFAVKVVNIRANKMEFIILLDIF